MGLTYTAEVFYGACVPRDTALGKWLDKYIDKHGGTPAPTEVPDVYIDVVGSWGGGDTWMVVRVKGGHSFARGHEIEPPALIASEDPKWRASIEAFFAHLKAKAPPIGWHFAGSVT